MPVPGVQILSNEAQQAQSQILTDDALKLIAALHRTFDSTRHNLLVARTVAQQRLDAGVPLDFAPETANIRADPAWLCAPPAPGLEDRRVEITGPPDRKMVINALNSGAKTFMADFEGASVRACPSSLRRSDASCRLQRADVRELAQWPGQPPGRYPSPDRLRDRWQVLQAYPKSRCPYRQVRHILPSYANSKLTFVTGREDGTSTSLA